MSFSANGKAPVHMPGDAAREREDGLQSLTAKDVTKTVKEAAIHRQGRWGDGGGIPLVTAPLSITLTLPHQEIRRWLVAGGWCRAVWALPGCICPREEVGGSVWREAAHPSQPLAACREAELQQPQTRTGTSFPRFDIFQPMV